jgi:type IV pilus assembly protein PilA
VIILGIGAPAYHRYLIHTREVAVTQELQTIYGAQVSYYSRYGRYAANLAELGPPATGAEGMKGAGLIPRVLSEASHNGYRFSLTGSAAGFTVTAVPDSSGGRTFYMDQDKAIHQSDTGEPANAQSPELR